MWRSLFFSFFFEIDYCVPPGTEPHVGCSTPGMDKYMVGDRHEWDVSMLFPP